MKTKVTKDGFVWLLFKREEAEYIFALDIADIYCLFDDDSESIIECPRDFDKSDTYGIEVGFLKDLNERWEKLEK